MKGPGRKKPKRGRGAGRPPERRVPPPESTGQEQRTFTEAARAGTMLNLRLRNGEVVRGRIEECYPQSLRLSTSGGHELLVPLAEIRYLHLEED